MEAALLHFVFHIAALLTTDVAKHLAEYPLQGVIANITSHGVVAVVADVEGGAVKMARVLSSILVMAL